GSILIRADRLAAGPRAERPDDVHRRARLEEPHRAIGHGDVGTARMIVAHAVHPRTIPLAVPATGSAIGILSLSFSALSLRRIATWCTSQSGVWSVNDTFSNRGRHPALFHAQDCGAGLPAHRIGRAPGPRTIGRSSISFREIRRI